MDAADLRGRRVGIPTRGDLGVELRRAMAVSGFAGALSLAGLGLADVELIELDADSTQHRPVRRSGPWDLELDALRSGVVDAVYVKGALTVAAAVRAGATVAVDLDRFPDRRVRVNNGTPRPITVDQRVLRERPDIVARFLAVLLQAADWAADGAADRRTAGLHPITGA